jgi:OFA family oxalate/formate antiporter-like MFS transporter
MSYTPAVEESNRWLQLVVGIVGMILIANLQYSWTLFVVPMHETHGWAVAEIQVAFSIFVALETWLTPAWGWIGDRLGAEAGPRLVTSLGGVLVALGWIVDAVAGSLSMLYLGGLLTGAGAGAVYATAVGNAAKWFPDRRGLAVGLTAMGFGAGAALSIIPIRLLIASKGYALTFFWFALIQGVIILMVAQFQRAPGEAEEAFAGLKPAKVPQTVRSYEPHEVLSSPVFWILWLMFVLIAASGLMVAAQLAPIARAYKVSNIVILFGGSVLTVALIVDNLLNGLARPFFGWVSDHIGRPLTMGLVFSLGALSYWLLGAFGTRPWLFVLFAGLIFFTWGEIFSLFPSMCTDLFGTGYATANASLLYTAKGAAGFLVPLGNVLAARTGNWHAVFLAAALMNIVVVLAALSILRSGAARHYAEGGAPSAGQPA